MDSPRHTNSCDKLFTWGVHKPPCWEIRKCRAPRPAGVVGGGAALAAVGAAWGVLPAAVGVVGGGIA
eukprot:4467821-Amphidinium_carterae.1